jgi:hypothetical protein
MNFFSKKTHGLNVEIEDIDDYVDPKKKALKKERPPSVDNSRRSQPKPLFEFQGRYEDDDG